MTPTLLPDSSILPTQLNAGFVAGACLDLSVTALERYQGAVLANDFSAAWNQVLNYRALEKCFLDNAGVEQQELVGILAGPDTPLGPVSTQVLKNAFADTTMSSFDGLDTTEFATLAGGLGVTAEELLNQVKQVVFDSPETVDLNSQVTELANAFAQTQSSWQPIMPANDVPEPPTLLLLALALLLSWRYRFASSNCQRRTGS